MTWEEWVESEYNTENYTIAVEYSVSYVKNSSNQTLCIDIAGVPATEKIIEGQVYAFYRGGSN
jgi:hypothetical protein